MAWKKKLKWCFPSTGGGHRQGYNDSSTAHFGNAVDSLIRETLQNSLDAADGDKKVHVDIYETSIEPSDINGSELAKHIKESLAFTDEEHQDEGIKLFSNALKILKDESIPVLSIVDSNTTGLNEHKWKSLVFTDGTTDKSGIDSPSGSYGIGKIAPYLMSDLKTICYSTHYQKDGKTYDRFTACARLTTHKNPDNPNDYLQNVGYGAKKLTQSGPVPLEGKDIPKQNVFLLKQSGTGIFVIGAKNHMRGWKNKATHSVLNNFFTAIREGNLEVSIDSKLINNSNIEEQLESSQKKPAYYYYHALKDPEQTKIFTQNDLGNFEVCFRKWDPPSKAPNSVAYVNRRGMLVTNDKTKKNNPFYVTGFVNLNYAIVVRAKDDKTDQLIRKMEPPHHQSLPISHIRDENESQMYEDALTQIRDKMKQFLNTLFGSGNEKYTVLDELDMFTDSKNSDDSNDSSDDNYVVSGSLKWRQVEPSSRPPSIKNEPGENIPKPPGSPPSKGTLQPPKPRKPGSGNRKRQPNVASRFKELRIARDNDVLRLAFTLDNELPIKFKIYRVGEEPLNQPILEINQFQVIRSSLKHDKVNLNDNVISIISPPKDERIMFEIPVTGSYTAYDLQEIISNTKPKQNRSETT